MAGVEMSTTITEITLDYRRIDLLLKAWRTPGEVLFSRPC